MPERPLDTAETFFFSNYNTSVKHSHFQSHNDGSCVKYYDLHAMKPASSMTRDKPSKQAAMSSTFAVNLITEQ